MPGVVRIMVLPSGLELELNVLGRAKATDVVVVSGAVDPGLVMVCAMEIEVGVLNVLGRVGASATVMVSQVVLVLVVVVVDVLYSPDCASARG